MPVDLDALLSQIDSLDSSDFEGDNASRLKLLNACQSLTKRIELPWDTTARWLWHEPNLHFAVRVAVDLDLFSKLNEGPRPMGLSQLSEKVGAEPDFLRRIMYDLCANQVLQMRGDGYDTTTLAKHLCKEEAISLVKYVNEVAWPSTTRMNIFFQENGYENPVDPKKCPWQTAMNTDETYFEWLGSHPKNRADFANVMKGYSATRPPWVSWVPTAKLLMNDDKTSPVMVDVGGSIGHDLTGFLMKHPDTAGRLVLQDLGDVIKSITDLDPGIQAMEHDFFTPQPVQGARFYFMHSIIHDWPDVVSQEILKNIKSAMKPGYSQIIIHDHMLKKSLPTVQSASIDLTMMGVLGAKERTEEDWISLLGAVGLKLVEVWSSPEIFQQVLLVDLE